MANVIFDFDGTIADTFPMVVELVSRWTGKQDKVEEQELEKLRNLPVHKAIEELGISSWRVPVMLIRGKRDMGKRMDEVQVIKGMPEVIKELHGQGHTMYIMSSNSPKNIRKFLKQYKLHDYFKRVYGGVGLFAKAKALKKVMKDNGLSGGHSFYIGDEIRDIHAAHKVGIRIVAVGWGYNGPGALAEENPTAMATKPSDLIKLLSS